MSPYHLAYFEDHPQFTKLFREQEDNAVNQQHKNQGIALRKGINQLFANQNISPKLSQQRSSSNTINALNEQNQHESSSQIIHDQIGNTQQKIKEFSQELVQQPTSKENFKQRSQAFSHFQESSQSSIHLKNMIGANSITNNLINQSINSGNTHSNIPIQQNTKVKEQIEHQGQQLDKIDDGKEQQNNITISSTTDMKDEITGINFIRERKQIENEMEIIEKELCQATIFYEQKYGKDIFIMKSILEHQNSYRKALPEDVVHAMIFLNITPNEYELFWIARSFTSLELPNFWIEVYDDESDDILFVNQLSNFKLNFHPSIVFIQKIIAIYKEKKDLQRLKEVQDKLAFKPKSYLFIPSPLQPSESSKIENKQKQLTPEESGVMIFENKLGKQYEINIPKLFNNLDRIESVQQEIVESSSSNKAEYITSLLNSLRRKDVKPINPSEFQDIEDLIFPRIEAEETQGDQARNSHSNLSTQLLDHKSNPTHKRQNSNLTDQHILVLTNDLNIKFPDDIHLLILLHEFLEAKESLNNNVWRFRCSESKRFYWYNTKFKRTLSYYPYLLQLKDLVALFQMTIKKDLSKVKINRNALKLFKLFDPKAPKSEIVSKIKQESKDLVRMFIQKNLKKEGECILSDDSSNQDEQSSEKEQKDTIDSKEETNQEKKKGQNIVSPNNSNKVLEQSYKSELYDENYKLKFVMNLLRNKNKMSEEEIKGKVLFCWPLKFKYKENELVNKFKHNKPYGNTKMKASNLDVQIKMQESQKKALSKLQNASKMIGMVKTSGKRITSNTTSSISQSTGFSSNISVGSNSDPFKVKMPPPTSFQVISQPTFFNGKVSKEQFNFSSNSSESNSTISSSSANEESSSSEEEQEIQEEQKENIKEELPVTQTNEINLIKNNSNCGSSESLNNKCEGIEGDIQGKQINYQNLSSSQLSESQDNKAGLQSKSDSSSNIGRISSFKFSKQGSLFEDSQDINDKNKSISRSSKKNSTDSKANDFIISIDSLAHYPAPLFDKQTPANQNYSQLQKSKNINDSTLNNGEQSTRLDSINTTTKSTKVREKSKTKNKKGKIKEKKGDKKKVQDKVITSKAPKKDEESKESSPDKMQKSVISSDKSPQPIKCEILSNSTLSEEDEEDEDDKSNSSDSKKSHSDQSNSSSENNMVDKESNSNQEKNINTPKKEEEIPEKQKVKDNSKKDLKTNKKGKENEVEKQANKEIKQKSNHKQKQKSKASSIISLKSEISSTHSKSKLGTESMKQESSLIVSSNEPKEETNQNIQNPSDIKQLDQSKEQQHQQNLSKQFLQSINTNKKKISSLRNSHGKKTLLFDEISPKVEQKVQEISQNKGESPALAEQEKTEKQPEKEGKVDIFLWKIESKKKKEDPNSSSKKAADSSKEDLKDSKQQEQKTQVDDSFKNVLENHFKDKGQKVNLFKESSPKTINMKKYITNDKIISEEEFEDEKIDLTPPTSFINNDDTPQFFLRSIGRPQTQAESFIQKRMNSPSSQFSPQLSPQYQTIPLSQKALNKIIYSSFMNPALSNDNPKPYPQKQSIFSNTLQSKIEIESNNNNNTNTNNRQSQLGRSFFSETKVQSSFTNNIIKNQYFQNTLQIHKIKKDAFFVDQFNSNIDKNNNNSNKDFRSKSPIVSPKNSIYCPHPKSNEFQPVKKVLIFPTLQAPTNHFVPSFSPRFFPDAHQSQTSSGTSTQSPRKIHSPRPIKIIQTITPMQAENSLKQKKQIKEKRSLLESQNNRSSLFLNQTGLQFNKSKLPSLPDRKLSTAPQIQRYRDNSHVGSCAVVSDMSGRQLMFQEQIQQCNLPEAHKNEEDKFKLKLGHISKYQDDFGSFKVKQMLSEILKKMPNLHLDFETRMRSKINEICIGQPSIKPSTYQMFAIEAEAHLELIKIKFLKKKLDIIAFDFIMNNLLIPKVAKKTIQDSEILKSRMYRHLRVFFRDIRKCLLQTKDIYSNLNRMIVDQAYEMGMIPHLFHLLSTKFQKQIKKLNEEKIFEKVVLYHQQKQQMSQHVILPLGNADEQLAEENLISDIESDKEDIKDLNPFGEQFQLMKSQILKKIVQEDKKKSRKLKNYFERLENGQDVGEDSEEEREYYENIKLYRTQKAKENGMNEADIPSEEEFQKHKKSSKKRKTKQKEKKIKKKDSKRKKSSYFNDLKDDEDDNASNLEGSQLGVSSISSDGEVKVEQEEDAARIELLSKVYSTPKYIFLFQNFLETQERISQLEDQNSIWKLLVNQIGHVHTLYRDSVKRVEVFLDYGYTKEDFMSMAKRLKIDGRREGDLLWIAYLYCGVLLRYSGGSNREILSSVLNASKLNDYDSYFLELVELNRVKRQFIINEMSDKNQYDYTVLSQWFKFYDSKEGQIFFYNPILKVSRSRIEKKYLLLQEQYRAIEKYKFIEMIDFIMKKLEDEEEKDQAIQFNSIFQLPKDLSSGQSFKRSILHYQSRNSISGSIQNLLQSNKNIASQIKNMKSLN